MAKDSSNPGKSEPKARPVIIHFVDSEGEPLVQREDVHTSGAYFAYIEDQPKDDAEEDAPEGEK